MTNEKLQSIQEKIHAEKLKIQEKFDKNQEKSQKIEEIPQKSEKIYAKGAEEINNFFERNINTKLNRRKIDRDFDRRMRDDDHDDSPSFSGLILSTIVIMIVGFSILTFGNYVINSISESVSLAEFGNSTPNLEVISNVKSVFLPFGLALMVFAGILFLLRIKDL